jgi:hypothetical protein
MDASFDQFGGGGWGAGDNEQDSSLIRKTNVADKIFVPAEIEDLLVLPVDDDKYFLGSYSFNTVKHFSLNFFYKTYVTGSCNGKNCQCAH